MLENIKRIFSALLGTPILFFLIWIATLMVIPGIAFGLSIFKAPAWLILILSLGLPAWGALGWAKHSFKSGQWYFSFAIVLGWIAGLLGLYALTGGKVFLQAP
jgi:hypothetical protein